MTSKDSLLIAALLNPDVKDKYEQAKNIVFYGEKPDGQTGLVDNNYSREIRRTARIYYSDLRYSSHFVDTYRVIVESLLRDLTNSLKEESDSILNYGLLRYICDHIKDYQSAVDYFFDKPIIDALVDSDNSEHDNAISMVFYGKLPIDNSLLVDHRFYKSIRERVADVYRPDVKDRYKRYSKTKEGDDNDSVFNETYSLVAKLLFQDIVDALRKDSNATKDTNLKGFICGHIKKGEIVQVTKVINGEKKRQHIKILESYRKQLDHHYDSYYIQGLIDTENPIQQSKIIEEIFNTNRELVQDDKKEGFEDNYFSGKIKSTVRYWYSGPTYSIQFTDVYTTIVGDLSQELIQYLSKKGDSAVSKCLRNLICSMVHNKSYRKNVNDLLGITDETVGFDTIEFREPSDDQEYYQDMLDDLWGNDDEVDKTIVRTHSDWGACFLDKLIKMLPVDEDKRKEYYNVLMVKYGSDLSSKEYGEEIGRSEGWVNTNRNRAMLALTQVSLPIIRAWSKGMFVRFRGLLPSSDMEVLEEFFDTGVIEDEDTIGKAIMRLIKMSDNEYEIEEKEYEKELQEKERAKKRNQGL